EDHVRPVLRAFLVVPLRAWLDRRCDARADTEVAVELRSEPSDQFRCDADREELDVLPSVERGAGHSSSESGGSPCAIRTARATSTMGWLRLWLSRWRRRYASGSLKCRTTISTRLACSITARFSSLRSSEAACSVKLRHSRKRVRATEIAGGRSSIEMGLIRKWKTGASTACEMVSESL